MFAAVVLFGPMIAFTPAYADDITTGSLRAAANQSPVSERTLGGATNGSPKAGCTCRHKGKDVFLGEFICMKTANGMMQAQCSRYLNNTSWTISQTPCPVS